MSIEDMAVRIVEAVDFWGAGTSFADLENELGEAMRGNQDIFLPGRPNGILWVGVSEEFSAALVSAMRSKKIVMRPSSLLVYAADGRIPSTPPVAEKLDPEDFKKPRWVPVTLSPAKKNMKPTQRDSCAGVGT